MSETPRTDAYVKVLIDNNRGAESLEQFARQLERELNAANERIKRLENIFSYAVNGASNAFDEAGIKPGEFVDRAKSAKERINRLEEVLDTLTAVVGLTPVTGNREALQEAFDASLAVLRAKESTP